MTLLGAACPLELSEGWGFWAHKQIHRLAVQAMPEPTAPFFREYATFLIEHAINADDRRRIDPSEAPQHFLNIDQYGKYPFPELPRRYEDAVKKYSFDTLRTYGLVPWRIAAFADSLTQAFRTKNLDKILFFAVNLGHYVADSHVPLHATENYDGQLTGQKGLHGRWESDIPERFMRHYETLGDIKPRVYYIADKTEESFKWILESYLLVDSVLKCDLKAKEGLKPEEICTIITDKNGREREIYTPLYYERFKQALGDMVERRFAQSVERVASIWYSAWVDAGKPDLSSLLSR
ncbi:MAG: zinc dependent phospholipase C family protein [Chloroherpetonaceae bacterium]|nr:zinc dependent phospholipase C family protein [Chloroherpetonaceae bacterium]